MSFIAKTAVIGKDCKIGENVTIHDYVVIYDGVEIGDDTEIFDHSVIGRPAKKAANLISPIDDMTTPTKIGKRCVIGAHVIVYSNCQFGNDVLLGDGAAIREGAIVEDKVLIARYVTLNHHVTIGANSKIMDLTHITSRTIIQENVFIGPGINTANDNNMSIFGNPVNAVIEFKEGCKVGAGAVVLPNIKIGENSIVAAQALVSHDVNPNTIVKGIPAR